MIILVPKFGVGGYIFTIYFTEMLNTTLSLARMIAIVKPKLRIFGHVLGPILCNTGATACVHVLSTALLLQPTAGTLVLQITLTALLYIALLMLTRCVSTDEYEILHAIFRAHRPSVKAIVPHKPRVD